MDKRKERRIESIKQKVAEQMTPEQKKEQLMQNKEQLESFIPIKEKEIVFMEEQLKTGKITFKDDKFVDNTMPPFKLEYLIIQSKQALEDSKKMLEEVNKNLEG